MSPQPDPTGALRPAASSALPTAAYVVLAAADTYLAGHPSPARRRWRRATKPLLMPTLMAAFGRATATPTREVAASTPTWSRAGGIVAQGFCGGGDVALLSGSETAFLAAVGSFSGAHVAYTATFVANGRPLADPAARRRTMTTLGAVGWLVPAATWAAGRDSPHLRGPVAAYAAMIAAMVASSTRMSDDVPLRARRTVVVGTGLFLLSDSVLAARKFLLPDPQPWSEAVVMATYTAGQGLIALGLAQITRAPRPADAAPPARVEETDG